MDRRCPRGTLSGPSGPLATPGPARGSLGALGMVFTTLLFFLTTIQNPENPEGYTASPSLSCPSIQPPAPQRPGAARVDRSKVNVRIHRRPASPSALCGAPHSSAGSGPSHSLPGGCRGGDKALGGARAARGLGPSGLLGSFAFPQGAFWPFWVWGWPWGDKDEMEENQYNAEIKM